MIRWTKAATVGRHMPGRRERVHCELGLFPHQDTTASRLREALPRELSQRGFRVTCSALLAQVANDAVPESLWDRQLLRLSHRWFAWALRHPRRFNGTRPFTAVAPRWRRRGVTIFLDPLYTLFYGAPDAGVVFVHDITPVTMEALHDPYVHWLYGRAFDWLARSRCHLIARCQNTADQLRANWGIAARRLSVLPPASAAHYFDELAALIRGNATEYPPAVRSGRRANVSALESLQLARE